MARPLTPIPSLSERDHARFWRKVEVQPGGQCWPWRGKLTQGYAMFSLGRQWFRASRIAWTVVYGALPDQTNVLHRCDNPICVRPSHLFTGTQADNVADMIEKGRRQPPLGQRGEANPRAVITEEKVREIRRRYRPGYGSQAALAREFGVSRTVVQAIVTRKTWKHVP